MPPMCSPVKNKSSDEAKPIQGLYFRARNESATESSDSDESYKDEIDKMMDDFPAFDKYFNLVGQVGGGTFSTVYEAALKSDPLRRRRFAVKHIVPTCHPDRTKFELKCLKEIGGKDNVAGIDLCLRHENNVLFVMPYQPHDLFVDYVRLMDLEEIVSYMKNLLVALARVHKFKVIHRDIKPSNFLYDRKTRRCLLVDFGLAQQQEDAGAKKKSEKSSKKRDPLSPSNGQVTDGKATDKRPEGQQVNLAKSSSNSVTTKPGVSLAKENFMNSRKSITCINFEQTPDAMRRSRTTDACKCYGKPRLCTACPLDNPMHASRAGTPGFRPPEVLLKYAHQTTAVDIWAAGTILLSILSGSGNFFSSPNDIAALVELVTIFGYDNLKKTSQMFGRYFLCSENRPQLDLRKICCILRNRGTKLNKVLSGKKCADCDQYKRVCLCIGVPLDEEIKDEFPEAAYHLLQRLLDVNPETRITAEQALKHEFFEV
ncbi:PREDICTED: cell division cycle 7-related protein kinase-like [Nicrophorus vespilloides]|uniref:non-specific serine/threonine protein kinase n=1 Tax=Nicrophorus vespilloides TaxID=110193 RepID=A0ABM1N0Z3_NICVS|nr:PREDICTED: cell division cycle 7-related protein kinase-like [Nicrophorus vespilloides]